MARRKPQRTWSRHYTYEQMMKGWEYGNLRPTFGQLGYIPGEKTTPDSLFHKGIGVCDQCGKLISLDDRWCGNCQSEAVIFRA